MFQRLRIFLAFFLCCITSESASYEFSQEYFGVHFAPYPSEADVGVAGAYNADGVLALGRKIGTKFRKIVMPNDDTKYDEDNSFHLIPSAVAKLNLERRSQGKPPLELTLLTHLVAETSDADVLKRFDFSLDLADKANAIFPGTIKLHQILTPERGINEEIKIVNYCRQKLNSNTNQYQLGVLLRFSACDSLFENSKEQLDQFLPRLNQLAFLIGPTDHTLKAGSQRFFKLIKPLMRACKNKVAKQGSPNLEVSFDSEWADTDDNGQQNTQFLVTFWKLMNDFATTTNTTIMMREAFDQPFKSSVNAHLGWWRLVESDTYSSAEDYVFQEKTDLEVLPPKKTPTKSRKNGQRTEVLQPANFSEEYFVVKLTPYPGTHDIGVAEAYDEAGLIALAKVVATRFRKLAQGSLINDVVFKPEHSLHLLPTAIAKLNVERAKTGQSHPMTIALTCDLQEDDVTPEVRKRFELTLELAEKANAIFPGTVDTLFQLSDREEALDKEIEILEHSRVTLNRSGNAYKLGLRYRFLACDTLLANDGAKRDKMLRLVDTIIFRAPPVDTIIKSGSKSFVGHLKRVTLSCKTKLLRVAPHLKLVFESYWPDTDDEGHQDFGQLVLFWQVMNNFAVSTKTTIVVDEAFDVPFYRSLRSHTGWWRLDESSEVTDATQYVFEEKMQLLARSEPENPVSSDSPPISSTEEAFTTERVIFAIKDPILDISTKKIEGAKGTNLGGGEHTVSIAVTVVVCFVSMAALLMVAFFHIKKQMSRIENRLPDEEVQAFFNGSSRNRPNQVADPDTSNNDVCGKAYDKNLEVEMEFVIIDKTSLLGSGTFGDVFKGHISKGQEMLAVAVKMTKVGCPTSAIRGLLAEIKIMSHIGKHENLVSIVGAHTSQLQTGNKVYIFLQLCELGSLESYLQNLHKNQQVRKLRYVNFVDSAQNNGAEMARLASRKDTEHDLQFLKWSIEIASGMEYLGRKQVVHADLATRNVLLTSEKIAKVSDFGLSRRLYEYTNYVKKKQEPLPWRWMAPESLRRLVFNEKTDVWAFGVTMWEICSLGEVPYPGLAWDVDFAEKLENGLRLKRPARDPYNLYEEMSNCWNPDPNERPSFTELSKALELRTATVLEQSMPEIV